MLSLLGWIIFGLVVGILAKLVMPGRDPGGVLITIGLGIAGAVVGGMVGRAMGFYGQADAAGFLCRFSARFSCSGFIGSSALDGYRSTCRQSLFSSGSAGKEAQRFYRR